MLRKLTSLTQSYNLPSTSAPAPGPKLQTSSSTASSLSPLPKRKSSQSMRSKSVTKTLTRRAKTTELPQIKIEAVDDVVPSDTVQPVVRLPSGPGGSGHSFKQVDPNVQSQVEVLRRENSALQLRLQQIITQLRDLQRERDEHLLVIREREILSRDLTSRLRTLENEKVEFLKTIQELHDQVNQTQQPQSLVSIKKSSTQDLSDEVSVEKLKREVEELKDALAKSSSLMAEYQLHARKKRTPTAAVDSKEKEFMARLVKRVPPWISNVSYLSPLILAYEERLEEKSVTIETYEADLMRLKEKVEELVKENQLLHIEQHSTVRQVEWKQLQQQAKLVLEENQVLVGQVEVLREKERDQHQAYVQEVARLTRRCIQFETDKAFIESDFNELQEKFRILATKKEPPVEKPAEESILLSKHTEIVERVEQELKELRHQSKDDVTALVKRVQDLEFERQFLVMQHSESNSQLVSMQYEIEQVLSKQKTWQKASKVLQSELANAHARVHSLSKQLDDAVLLGEQLANDRSSLMSLSVDKDKEIVEQKRKVDRLQLAVQRLNDRVRTLRSILRAKQKKEKREEMEMLRELPKKRTSAAPHRSPKGKGADRKREDTGKEVAEGGQVDSDLDFASLEDNLVLYDEDQISDFDF